jgi:hypothetical protein
MTATLGRTSTQTDLLVFHVNQVDIKDNTTNPVVLLVEKGSTMTLLEVFFNPTAKMTAMLDPTSMLTDLRVLYANKVDIKTKTTSPVALVAKKESTMASQHKPLNPPAITAAVLDRTSMLTDLLASCVNLADIKIKRTNQYAKMTATLGRTSTLIKLRVSCVKKVDIKIKMINLLVCLAKKESTMISQHELLNLIAKTAQQESSTNSKNSSIVKIVKKESTMNSRLNLIAKIVKKESTI